MSGASHRRHGSPSKRLVSQATPVAAARSLPQRQASGLFLLSLGLLALFLAFAQSARAVDVRVNVSSDEFNPPAVTIQQGDRVIWENVQGTHNVMADDGSFRSGDPDEPGWVFAHEFNEVGVFRYFCELHGGPGSEGHSGTVTVEEGSPGEIQFATDSSVVDEDEGQASVILRRLQGRTGAVSVSYESLASGTADEGVDYLPVSGSVSWEDGDSQPKTFFVPIVDDNETEGAETIPLRIFSPVGAELGEVTETSVTIIDDESTNPECEEDSVTLCLQQDRFRVRATFETQQGQSGQARVVQLTQDTGYLWFFNPSNVEAVVKVLDGCSNNSHFWVFAGGLTNVRVRLRVVDTETGDVRVYTNPVRTPFDPIQDTRAFPNCP